MRKVLLMCILMVSCVLCGCSNQKSRDPKLTSYETYYHAVEENVKFNETSAHFHYSTEMSVLPDGTFRYYIVIDEPQHAMYQFTALAVENDSVFSAESKMMPSLGIFDEPVTMIPNQVNTEKRFVKGVVLSGESREPSVSIRLLAEWKDKTGKNAVREFLSFVISKEEQPAEQTEPVEQTEPAEGEGGA